MGRLRHWAALASALLLAGMAPRQEQSVELQSPDGKTVLVAGVPEHTDERCGTHWGGIRGWQP
jgi:hypothetical protein